MIGAEILFLNIVGQLLFRDDFTSITALNKEEFEKQFDYFATAVDLEDDIFSSPKITLFRNKLIIKLIKKYGLLSTLKKLKSLNTIITSAKQNLCNLSPVCESNLFLTLATINDLLQRLENYYKIFVLEKLSAIFTYLDYCDEQNIMKLFNQKKLLEENDILDFFCVKNKKITIGQLNLDQEVDPLPPEIAYIEDEPYQIRVSDNKKKKKSKAIEAIIKSGADTKLILKAEEVYRILYLISNASKTSEEIENFDIFLKYSEILLSELDSEISAFKKEKALTLRRKH